MKAPLLRHLYIFFFLSPSQFKEQIEWAVEAGADFIIGETFGAYDEAALALDCIKKYGKGVLHIFFKGIVLFLNSKTKYIYIYTQCLSQKLCFKNSVLHFFLNGGFEFITLIHLVDICHIR